MSHCGAKDDCLYPGSPNENFAAFSQYNRNELEEEQDHLDVDMIDSSRCYFNDTGANLNLRNRQKSQIIGATPMSAEKRFMGSSLMPEDMIGKS